MSMPVVPYQVSNFGQLKQAVQLWADRDDAEFVNQIPNFINYAQKQIYRQLRVPSLQKEAYLVLRNGVAAIPTDLQEIDHIRNMSGVVFRPTSRENISNSIQAWKGMKCPTSGIEAADVKWARYGQYLYFYPQISSELPSEDVIKDGTFTGDEVVIDYYYDPVEYVNDSDTDSLLVVAPDALLYLSLANAARFVQDDNGEQQNLALARGVIDGLVEQQKMMEYAGGYKVVEASSDYGMSAAVYSYI